MPAWLPRSAVVAALLLFAAGCIAACPDDPEDGGGTAWTEAFDAADHGWLLNVWGPSGDRMWAVGGTPDVGEVVTFDGERWETADLPVDVPLLNWTTGFGPDEVFVVGNGGVVLEWDGSGWTEHQPPTEQNLWGIWGASADDLWAVGGSGRRDGDATVLRNVSGSWELVALPALQKAQVRAFFKVWGTSADNIYIVGQNGAVLHWDGSQLTEELVGASDDLIALWGTGPDRIVMVGGRNNALVTTWDGTSWRTQSLAPLPGLNGVWMRDPNAIHAVGVFGTVARIDFDTLAWELDEIETGYDFHAIFGDPSGGITAVGGSLRSPAGPFVGLAWTRELADDE